MTIKRKFLLLAMILVAASLGLGHWLRGGGRVAPAGKDERSAPTAIQAAVRPGSIHETAHYAISSTATPTQTQRVAQAVESFHDAYIAFFGDMIAGNGHRAKLKLVLYRDRQEFSANNRSRPWAEAYYLAPNCHAYYSEGSPNPYHWMLHEATHQLNNEVAHFRKTKWIDEGLATYFGTSRIVDGKLLPGQIDANTYPVWWLSQLWLSGNLREDIDRDRVIPLAALVSGKDAPDIDAHVNLYYIEYWSLSHFLFHYRDGHYAGRYRQLIAAGGSLENFERIIGPMDRVQDEWYSYLREKIDEAGADTGTTVMQ